MLVWYSREREQRVPRNQNEKLEYLKIIIDGATIPVSTIWDALALFYTINIGKPPESLTSLDQQTRWVIQHLNQLARWVLIFEPIPEDVKTIRNRHQVQPSTTAVAWKLEGQRIMKISFRASLIGDKNIRKQLIKCVEIRRTEDHENLIRGVANRRQEYQKTINKVSTESRLTDPSSLSSGREWEFDKESNVLAIQKLCGDDHIVPSSIIETGTTNQNLCDTDSISRNDATLRELPPNHTLDVASLLKLLKNKYSYHEATNNDILTDYENRLLDVVYRITDYRIVLACSNYCFWLEVPDGVIYLWSRIDDSMVRGGDNMEETLTNYLFNRENLRYIVENSLELIPLDAYDEEAEEWANSPEACIDVTKLSIKHESKMGGKKKQQKKKKKEKE
ncbi:unnamed protein product [Rhizophagus irregularis]|uniref:Uncharacterized protein n=1 Tax=Rhizophagus irregularis TaxID=588596 RepID=A0A2I1GVP9_9GLOM|nr:hypothetical protein RhiirA4_531135 [Rhizophagus irregularis]CAB4419151.1 unnamed protein product [Rhizophagus irregularis]